MKKYKHLKWSKLYGRKPFFEAIISNDNGTLFTIGYGKVQKIYFRVMENVHKDHQTDEYVYIDRSREVIVRTGAYAGRGGPILSENDMLNWIEKYHKDAEAYEKQKAENMKRAAEKRKATLKRKREQKKKEKMNEFK